MIEKRTKKIKAYLILSIGLHSYTRTYMKNEGQVYFTPGASFLCSLKMIEKQPFW